MGKVEYVHRGTGDRSEASSAKTDNAVANTFHESEQLNRKDTHLVTEARV